MSTERRMNLDFAKAYLKASNEFTEMYDRASLSPLHPPKIEGYTWYEGWMLGLQLAMVMSPKLLVLSECNHRAVGATLGLHLETKPTIDQRIELARYCVNNGVLGSFIVTPNDETYLIFFGTNNWTTNTENLSQDETLDCKTMPGYPIDVKKTNLPHLEVDLPFEDNSHVDNACPKRTKHVDCHVTHAEATVITHAKKIYEELELSKSQKTILTCTWVPCPDCVNLITENRNIFGNQINVSSVYGAMNDEDDVEMAKHIKENLEKDGLGILSGPYISIPKNPPGYGWWPVLKSSIRQLKSHGSLVRGGYESQILNYALSLVDES